MPLAVVAIALVASGCFGGGGGGGGPQAADFLNRVNAARGSAGAPALVLCGTLNGASAAHADDMARNGFLSHTGSDGSQPPDRMARHGYGPLGSFNWGETIARGPTSVAETFNLWMASPDHRNIILNPIYRHLGFGHVGAYWVAVFGAAGRC